MRNSHRQRTRVAVETPVSIRSTSRVRMRPGIIALALAAAAASACTTTPTAEPAAPHTPATTESSTDSDAMPPPDPETPRDTGISSEHDPLGAPDLGRPSEEGENDQYEDSLDGWELQRTFWDAQNEAAESDLRFVAIDAGSHHTCGLRTDGTIACWGYNGYGQSDPPPMASSAQSPPVKSTPAACAPTVPSHAGETTITDRQTPRMDRSAWYRLAPHTPVHCDRADGPAAGASATPANSTHQPILLCRLQLDGVTLVDCGPTAKPAAGVGCPMARSIRQRATLLIYQPASTEHALCAQTTRPCAGEDFHTGTGPVSSMDSTAPRLESTRFQWAGPTGVSWSTRENPAAGERFVAVAATLRLNSFSPSKMYRPANRMPAD